MYGRSYGERELNFEASGGLLHAALVMQDDETSTYWSIMSGDAIGGELKGTPLEELAIGRKLPMAEWSRLHPNTLVLSVDGMEHVQSSPYDNYFTSEEGFRGMTATDDRLPSKAPVFTFHRGEKAYAVPYTAIEGGKVFTVGGAELLLYRSKGASVFESTQAFVGNGFERKGDTWIETATSAKLSSGQGGFIGGKANRLEGMDTFWYTWSLNNPTTILLTGDND